jgi:hypothetical protein
VLRVSRPVPEGPPSPQIYRKAVVERFVEGAENSLEDHRVCIKGRLAQDGRGASQPVRSPDAFCRKKSKADVASRDSRKPRVMCCLAGC